MGSLLKIGLEAIHSFIFIQLSTSSLEYFISLKANSIPEHLCNVMIVVLRHRIMCLCLTKFKQYRSLGESFVIFNSDRTH